jgi:hypothetical protein
MSDAFMSEREFAGLMSEAISVAERSFSQASFELAGPADAENLKEVASNLGSFSDSHYAFLARHNGLTIRVFSENQSANGTMVLVEDYVLEIFGLSSIEWMTRNFREHFAMAYEPALPYLSPSSAARFVNLASAIPGDNRIVSCLDRPTTRGEFLIKDVRIDMSRWLRDETDRTTQWLVAESFDDFLGGCLRHFITTGSGFAYWNPTITD